jgi:hypothetical protein
MSNEKPDDVKPNDVKPDSDIWSVPLSTVAEPV